MEKRNKYSKCKIQIQLKIDIRIFKNNWTLTQQKTFGMKNCLKQIPRKNSSNPSNVFIVIKRSHTQSLRRKEIETSYTRRHCWNTSVPLQISIWHWKQQQEPVSFAHWMVRFFSEIYYRTLIFNEEKSHWFFFFYLYSIFMSKSFLFFNFRCHSLHRFSIQAGAKNMCCGPSKASKFTLFSTSKICQRLVWNGFGSLSMDQ